MGDNKLLSALGNIDEKYYLDIIPAKYEGKIRKNSRRFVNAAAVVLAFLIIGGTTVYAYYVFTNRTEINHEELPSIGEMSCIESWDFSNVDEQTVYPDYEQFKDLAKLDLLSSLLSASNPYMRVTVRTDKKDYASIRVENYILGDTTNYQPNEGGNDEAGDTTDYQRLDGYIYDSGEVYKSSIMLEVELILSQEGLKKGFISEYMGEYELADSYITKDGMSVNLIQDKYEDEPDDWISNKIAIFIKDGVKYTLSGRVPLDEMKHIVETMQ